jgi:hypothetical protein
MAIHMLLHVGMCKVSEIYYSVKEIETLGRDI